MPPTYVKLNQISLKNHPELTERWVQDRIAEDPAILGLGDLILRDRERPQPRAGRLDLLLQDPDSGQRFEVELQLGATDESHLIRTIEYWDIERKRYLQYEHTAVIVAENITSRFLNVISLFNSAIPLVAIQMQALQVGESVSLVFTTVLDQTRLGSEDEDEVASEVTDRAYWERTATKSNLDLIDSMFSELRKLDGRLSPRYSKHYIGVSKDGQPDNFVVFKSRRSFLYVEPRLNKDEEFQRKLEDAGLDSVEHLERWRRYRIRVDHKTYEKHAQLLIEVIRRALEESED
jgi:hypothetical protein